MLRLLHLTATLLSGYAHLLRTEAESSLDARAHARRRRDADLAPHADR